MERSSCGTDINFLFFFHLITNDEKDIFIINYFLIRSLMSCLKIFDHQFLCLDRLERQMVIDESKL
jgi:hypothetical protein